jgi:hypothetical protein
MPFTFTSSGYTMPNPSNMKFNFGAMSYTDLKAAINILSEDYIKECPTYTIATKYGIQIIQLPCIYSGFRNIGGYIYGNPPHADLGASIKPVFGMADLSAYIKSTFQSYKDLGGRTRTFYREHLDLGAAIQWIVHEESDLPANLAGVFLKGEMDLQAILNFIEVRDLPAFIHPELIKGQLDLGGRTRTFYREHLDLGSRANIFQRGYLDLGVYIYAPMDLQGIINVISKFDLPASIKAFPLSTTDLQAYLNIIQIGNLQANIHGWDIRNLPAMATGAYGPYDLQASIIGSGGYKQLYAYVRGMLGTEIPYNLPAFLEGFFSKDLPASIFAAVNRLDLQGIINATGQAVDLPANIVPRVIYMTQVLQIALLEHKDLKAMINSACFGTGSFNLYAYVRAIYKKDLQGIIFGWHVNIYSNVIDLVACINTEDYYVQDKAAPWFFAEDRESFHIRLKLTFDATGPAYTVFDTQPIFFGTATYANLTAVVTGILHSVDLPATVTARYDFNFTQLPYHISPRTREVVIEFDSKWRERWRRFVEIFFDDSGNTPYHYFYVAGANKVYRVDRNRHWTIWAKGFDESEDEMIERYNVRYKFIFNAAKYSTVDEAIRDLIDRVSTYRRVDLAAQIYGDLPTHANLSALITPDVKFSWVKHLRSSVIGRLRFYKGTQDFDLPALITGV